MEQLVGWVALGATGVLVAWGVVRSTPVHAAPMVNIRDIPIAGTIYNDCGGENVDYSGAFQIVISSTTDGAGGTHGTISINWHGVKGVGETSGARYQIPEEHHSTGSVDPQGGYVESNSQNFRLIGQGPDNNAVANFLFHITVTPDGAVTADITDARFVCH